MLAEQYKRTANLLFTDRPLFFFCLFVCVQVQSIPAGTVVKAMPMHANCQIGASSATSKSDGVKCKFSLAMHEEQSQPAVGAPTRSHGVVLAPTRTTYCNENDDDMAKADRKNCFHILHVLRTSSRRERDHARASNPLR